MNRRDFLAASAVAVGARLAFAQNRRVPVEHIVQTPVLDIGYEESGNANGFPVILLHGFPDDVHAYDDVVAPLVEAGHRVLVPYLRGYGKTRFRDPNTVREAVVQSVRRTLESDRKTWQQQMKRVISLSVQAS